MTHPDWVEWLPTFVSLAILIIVFVGRTWLRTTIERRVQHNFDQKIEGVRADFRASEERLRSELRTKEADIAALRDRVLSGRAQRQAIIDRRRIDAVERVWLAIVGLGPYRALAGMITPFDLAAAAEEAPHNPGVRRMFETMSQVAPKGVPENIALKERPFISPLAWAYFSAYQTVLLVIWAQVKALELGVPKSIDLIKLDKLKNTMKAVLPHQSPVIDRLDLGTFSILFDELEENILIELRRILDGKDVDQATITRSAEIMNDVKVLSKEMDRITTKIVPST